MELSVINTSCRVLLRLNNVITFDKTTNMRIAQSVLVLVILSVILMACPYKSDVGIDDGPAVKMNTELLGTWRKSSYPVDSTQLIFTKASAKKFLIDATTSDGDAGYEKSNYEIWYSPVDNRQLITLYNTESKKIFLWRTGTFWQPPGYKIILGRYYHAAVYQYCSHA